MGWRLCTTRGIGTTEMMEGDAVRHHGEDRDRGGAGDRDGDREWDGRTTMRFGTMRKIGIAVVRGIVQENPVLPLIKKYFINTKQLYLRREQAEFSLELIKGVFIRSFPKLRSHEYCH